MKTDIEIAQEAEMMPIKNVKKSKIMKMEN